MPANLAQRQARAHHLSLEVGPARMAKANLNRIDVSYLRPLVGACIARACRLLDWSAKELAGAIEQATGLERDPGQVSRWMTGKERPQLDMLFAVEKFRGVFAIAVAEIDTAAEVATTIRIKRSRS